MTGGFRPVVGFPHYEVSDYGAVRSLARMVQHGGWWRRQPAQPMRTFLDRDGYERIKLRRDDGARVDCKVHVLVAEAFLPPRPAGATEVRHLDDDRARNDVTNLAWGTHSDNERDKVAHGRAPAAFSPRERCLRKHLLVAPNLVAGSDKRKCLACKRGRDEVRDTRRRNGWVLDVQVQADLHYAQIMKGQAA